MYNGFGLINVPVVTTNLKPTTQFLKWWEMPSTFQKDVYITMFDFWFLSNFQCWTCDSIMQIFITSYLVAIRSYLSAAWWLRNHIVEGFQEQNLPFLCEVLEIEHKQLPRFSPQVPKPLFDVRLILHHQRPEEGLINNISSLHTSRMRGRNIQCWSLHFIWLCRLNYLRLWVPQVDQEGQLGFAIHGQPSWRGIKSRTDRTETSRNERDYQSQTLHWD